MPPPAILGQYNDLVANGGERVFKQFEKEADHRRQMNRETLRIQSRDLLIGKCFALLYLLSMAYVTTLAIKSGFPILAGTLATGVLVSVVLAFLRVTGEKAPETQRKK